MTISRISAVGHWFNSARIPIFGFSTVLIPVWFGTGSHFRLLHCTTSRKQIGFANLPLGLYSYSFLWSCFARTPTLFTATSCPIEDTSVDHNFKQLSRGYIIFIFLYLSISLIKIAEFHSIHKCTQETDWIIYRDLENNKRIYVDCSIIVRITV